MRVKLSEIGICDNTRADDNISVSSLMSSIKEKGQLTPITITNNFADSGVKNKKYIIVCGHRRFSAISKLGRKTIEASVREVTNRKDLMLDNLSENIHREDVSPLEEGRFFNMLMRDHKMTRAEIAVRLSVGAPHISRAISAYENIPKKYRDKVVKVTANKRSTPRGKIALTVAAEIVNVAKVKKLNKRAQNKLFDLAMDKHANTTDVRGILRNYDNNKTPEQNIKFLKKERDNVNYVRMDILLKNEDVDRLMKKHQYAKGILIQKILYGEIKDTFSRP